MRHVLVMLLFLEVLLYTFEMVEWLQLGILAAEHVSLNEPRKPCTGLVFDESSGGHGKDIIQLLECAAWSLAATGIS